MTGAPPEVRVDVVSPDSGFSVRGSVVGDVLHLAVAGEADFANTSPARTASIGDVFLASGATSITLDLSGVAFLDSGGLSWLVRLRALASSKGGSVRVTASSARVERVLRISGVAPLFSG
ncbi:MAG: STAS domain-containing protein [Candidatus Nanopelagicales bacterium]